MSLFKNLTYTASNTSILTLLQSTALYKMAPRNLMHVYLNLMLLLKCENDQPIFSHDNGIGCFSRIRMQNCLERLLWHIGT